MNYLIEENGRKMHYYLVKGKGIFKTRIFASRLGIRETVLLGNVTAFGLFVKDNTVHIMAQKDDELLYMVSENRHTKKFIIEKIPSGVEILNIHLYPISNRLNMLYTAKISNDLHLMHLILASNEKPRSLMITSSPDFFVSDKRVYALNKNGDSGFFELEGENPKFFIQMSKNSSVPYILSGHTAFFSNGKIFFDSCEIAREDDANRVIILEYNGDIYVAWRSGDFVKYIIATDKNDKPHTIINPSRLPVLFTLWQGDECYHFYGSCSGTELMTYINPSPFNYNPQKNKDNFLIRKMESMRLEIEELRNQLSELK